MIINFHPLYMLGIEWLNMAPAWEKAREYYAIDLISLGAVQGASISQKAVKIWTSRIHLLKPEVIFILKRCYSGTVHNYRNKKIKK